MPRSHRKDINLLVLHLFQTHFAFLAQYSTCILPLPSVKITAFTEKSILALTEFWLHFNWIWLILGCILTEFWLNFDWILTEFSLYFDCILTWLRMLKKVLFKAFFSLVFQFFNHVTITKWTNSWPIKIFTMSVVKSFATHEAKYAFNDWNFSHATFVLHFSDVTLISK